MTKKPLRIALTFDAEMDAFDASITSARALEWRGIEEGIPVIDEILGQVQDSEGGRARATWFVRCDDQIGHITGRSAHLLERYRDCWERHQRLGDEIAFHAHLYREVNGSWFQDTDAVRLREQILRALGAMRAAGFYSEVSRIGEAFGSNAVMSALDESGMRCDSTAMPGRVRLDAERSMDWRTTPSCAYHPSKADYRIPGNPAWRLLEIPMNMVSTLADYDQKPLMRYLDLSFHPRAVRGAFHDVVANAGAIVTLTHPSTVLPEVNQDSHGLLSFNAEAFEENLQQLLSECALQGRPFRFITLKDAVGIDLS